MCKIRKHGGFSQNRSHFRDLSRLNRMLAIKMYSIFNSSFDNFYYLLASALQHQDVQLLKLKILKISRDQSLIHSHNKGVHERTPTTFWSLNTYQYHMLFWFIPLNVFLTRRAPGFLKLLSWSRYLHGRSAPKIGSAD